MNKFHKTLFVLFLLLSGLSLQASADAGIDKLELPLGDVTLKPGTALKLKALALKLDADLDVNSINLLAIDVLAKSRQGKGTVRLRVGNNLTAWTNVPGTQSTFDSKEAGSYSSIKLRSPEEGKGQLWQLLVNGYIKIKKITLYTTNAMSSSGGSI